MGRPPCCDKSNVKRGLWTAEEDAKILAHVSTHGTGNWTSVPKKAGLKRCGKSCRLRWTNYLRPDLKHESFTPQEEELIVTLHATIGSRWSLIAGQLPGRTDNDVKNYWNTKLRKKLCEMGIDPVTHKPISQIIADYRSIGLLKGGSSSSSKHDLLRSQPLNNARISCLSKDLRNAFMSKSKPAQTTTQNDIPNFSMPTTKMEDGILNNNPTWDLLAQLHAIKLVTDASNCTNQQTLFLNEASSSTAPSIAANHQGDIEKTVALQTFSSQPSQPQDTPSPSSFSWSEFLLEDVFLPLEQEDSHVLSSTDSSSLNPELEVTDNESYNCNEFAVPAGDGYCYTDQGYNMFGGVAGSASANSFVETILDRDSEMSWDFPDILNDP